MGEEDTGSMRPSDVGLVVEDDSVGWELEEEFVGFCLLCAEPMTKLMGRGPGAKSNVRNLERLRRTIELPVAG